jgi:hypothetical protein
VETYAVRREEQREARNAVKRARSAIEQVVALSAAAAQQRATQAQEQVCGSSSNLALFIKFFSLGFLLLFVKVPQINC